MQRTARGRWKLVTIRVVGQIDERLTQCLPEFQIQPLVHINHPSKPIRNSFMELLDLLCFMRREVDLI